MRKHEHLNRREFVVGLAQTLSLFGLQGVISKAALASPSGPTRLVCFVIKYTGGATGANGVGDWSIDKVLAPLVPFQSRLAIPLGLSADFPNIPMNDHSAVELSALSGSSTYFEHHPDGDYPSGNLINYSTGDGKSIDKLIAEKLQKDFSTPLEMLRMANETSYPDELTRRASSWGKDGKLLSSITSLVDLQTQVESNVGCQKQSLRAYQIRQAVLKRVKDNHDLFLNSQLIDRDRFMALEERVSRLAEETDAILRSIGQNGANPCNSIVTEQEVSGSETSASLFQQKMDKMYEYAIKAFKNNVTRVVTFNLHMSSTHDPASHYSLNNSYGQYLNNCTVYQQSIRKFLDKLQAANLFDETLIYCHAGASTAKDCHNKENLSTYVINAPRTGVIGSASSRKPIGSLLADILNQFGIPFSEYGGRNHACGVGRRGEVL